MQDASGLQKRSGNIPRELFHWITFLCKALPPISAGTFIELLIGSTLTPTDFVTECLFDAGYAKPLDQLLQIITEWQMVMVGLNTAIYSTHTKSSEDQHGPLGD